VRGPNLITKINALLSFSKLRFK